MSNDSPKDGSLRVWWVPQIPCESFYVPVNNLAEAALVIKTLTEYDFFQLKHNIKPDYCNMGGLQIWEEQMDFDEDGSKWCDWYDDKTGMDFEEYWETHHAERPNR